MPNGFFMHQKIGCHQIAVVELVDSSDLVDSLESGEYQPVRENNFNQRYLTTYTTLNLLYLILLYYFR